LCAVNNHSGVSFDYVEPWEAVGLGLTDSHFAAHYAWAVTVAKNMGLLVAAQDGSKVLPESGMLPQLDVAITQGCVGYGNCELYSMLSECQYNPGPVKRIRFCQSRRKPLHRCCSCLHSVV
jgi:hypothetical protein